ncbi:MAG: hypothetical protein LBU58_01510 [Clostridiales bacterium]|nr:hypothetical protein [Clostridiales bacterium]
MNMGGPAQNLDDALSVLQIGAIEKKHDYDDYYVNTMPSRVSENGNDVIEMMYFSISRAKDPCRILYSGHMGSGKSTELFRLRTKLAENNFFVCYANIEGKLDFTTLTHTDLLIFILETLLEYARANELDVDDRKLTGIKDYLRSEHEKIRASSGLTQSELEASLEAKTPKLLSAVLSIVGNLRASMQIQSDYREVWRENMKPDINTYIGMINDVLADVKDAAAKKGKADAYPIILLDSLEKIDEEPAMTLFRAHSQDLARLYANMVISFPIGLTYMSDFNQIENYYADIQTLPMIKLRTWNQNERVYENENEPPENLPGCQVLKKMILKRVDDSLMDEGVLSLIVLKTGGFIRDLLYAVYYATLNALAGGRGRIEMRDAKVALTKMRSDISKRFDKEGFERLKIIIGGEKVYHSDAPLMKLLQCGAALEYNGTRWVDAHPLVVEWMEENGMI